MPQAAGTLELAARELGNLLAPLEQKLSPGEVVPFFAELGLQFPPALTAQAGLMTALGQGAAAAAALPPLVVQLIAAIDADNAAQAIKKGVEIIDAARTAITRLDAVATALNAIGGGLPGVSASDIAAFSATLATRIVEYLVLSHLEGYFPLSLEVLRVAGVAEFAEVPAVAGDPTKPAHTTRRLHFDRLGPLLSDPVAALKGQLGWGEPAFDGQELLRRLHDLLFTLSIPATLEPIPAGGGKKKLRVLLLSIAPDATTTPPGLTATLAIDLGNDFGLSIPFILPGWTLGFDAAGQFDASTAIGFTPPDRIRVIPPAGAVSGTLETSLTAGFPQPQPALVLLGKAGGTRLEVRRLGFRVGTSLEWDSVNRQANGELLLGARLEDGKLVISVAEGDGFLTRILPPNGITADFGIDASWSPSKGLRFRGSGGLELTVPVNLQLGPVEVVSIFFRVSVDGNGMEVQLAASGAAVIGPIVATVERIGLRAPLAFHKGNLGPVDLSLAFLPPTGVGLAVSAGPITGGGFISFDEPNGRYAGVLALEVFSVKVSAIGLIDTRLPDGRPGYSFLIIISVEFFPIQLGFGFTLLGVGGICGIHRTINAEALRMGVYAGSLDSIMFPRDPVRNAPQLITDLSRIFPPAEGQFVFGPMAKIGWGTPTLVEISLGIVIELPDPIRIALLGQIAAFFPERSAAIVELHIDFVAMIDFGAKLLSLDATLRDSRIVVWTLTGDMALRLCWGDPPSFAVALGGFHPHFQPPPGFPALRRLTLALGAGDFIRISCQTYQALTSNSLQFGARAELYISVGVYVRGWVGFDALIIFSPFGFEVDICAGLEIGVGDIQLAGISFDGSLSGTNPWRVHGTATISVLFFEISVHPDVKFGSEEKASLQPIDPWPALRDALKDPRNWAALPAAGTLPVATLTLPAGTTATVIDPAGKMTWKETVAPLDRTLTKFGNSSPPAPVKFTVDRVTVGANAAASAPIQDFFAAAQFEELTDQEKLSRPSFELMQAGLEVASSAVRAGPSISAPLTYETDYKDPEHGRRVRSLFDLPLWMQRGALESGGLRAGGLAGAGTRAYAGKAQLAQVEEQFVVVSTVDLSVQTTVTAPTTKGGAHQALKQHLAAHPGQRGALQVVPLHELEAA
jgi:hypothetical protein